MIPVMVVDDEKYVRAGIVNDTDWSLIGCEVVCEASNGEDALKKAESCRPELVISDIRMPKLDGIGLAEKLLEKYPGTKVIFLTAYNDFEYARQAIRIGVCDYILKPFHDGELEASIQRLLHLQIPEEKKKEPDFEDRLLLLKGLDEVSSRYVRNALLYIADHYAETDFSVGRLADAICVSEGHIGRLFKTEVGTGINSYLTRYRVRRSMDILKDVSVKVYEVAGMVGYQDIAYFSNTFKKLVGKAPSDYQSTGLE